MIIITANQNQSFALKKLPEYAAAKILSWSEIVTECLRGTNQRILTSTESGFVWRQCVQQSEVSGNDSLAALAEEAWWLVQHWQISLESLAKSQQMNTQWFYALTKKFIAYCQKYHCMDEVHALADLIANPAKIKACFAEEEVKFYGFFALTPLQEKFSKIVSSSSCVNLMLTMDTPLRENNEIQGFCYENPEEELEAILVRALSEYQKDSNKKITVIVPELAYHRSKVESILFALTDQQLWHFAVPETLFNQPLVQAVFQVLKQNAEKEILLNDLIALLHNPFLDGALTEKIERAQLAANFRALQVSKLDQDTLLKLAAPWPRLEKQLSHIYLMPAKGRKALKDWVIYWANILTQIGFAQDRYLSEHEKAVLNQWQATLEALALLFPWQTNFHAHEAIALLKALTQKKYVKAQQGAQGIYISGVVDALQRQVDNIYLSNAVQGAIPFPIQANPLVDKKLQYQLGVWAVRQDLQAQWALTCFQQLKKVCKSLTVSYAKENNGRINLPAFAFLQYENAYCALPEQAETSSCVLDATDLPNSLQADFVPGGTSALKSQRACPMQAFGRYRLHLEALPEATLGLTPIERGIVMHRALQLIWQQLQSQEKLQSLSLDDLTALVHKIIPLALKQIDWSRRKCLPKVLMELESQYLIANVQRWLVLEATRPPFKIRALEQETQVSFANKMWRLRVDRIDELGDGRLILIDYKTGSVSAQVWQPDVLTDPQLPFYVIVNALLIDGIAFAELSAQHLRMVGIAHDNISLGKLGLLKAVDNWGALKEEWRIVLEKLTNEFVYTDASLAPLEGPLTCGRCDLQAFCRIFDVNTPVISRVGKA